jgi:signal-transduction protein with cAMP-binding, CBS, and nucleotidyltransferase domain
MTQHSQPERLPHVPGSTAADGQQQGIRCRFCGFDNPVGGDACENCGAELNEGIPQPADEYQSGLLGTPLSELTTTGWLRLEQEVDALDAVTRMKAEGADCILVTDRGELRGIFTDRDAMVKLAGRRPPGPTLRDAMTPDPDVLLAGDTVAMAIHRMAVGGLRHIPLVHPDGSVSVVAARDLFRQLIAIRD